jgi:glycosyltransferase involved in cell wall biosynthesis
VKRLPEAEKAVLAARMLAAGRRERTPSVRPRPLSYSPLGFFARLRRRLSLVRLAFNARYIRDKGDILKSGAFDRAWYLERHPDVSALEVDPLDHYVGFGAVEGRNPNSIFSSRWYLNANPDVAAAGTNPLAHYVRAGWREVRDPSPDFSTVRYLQEYPFLADLGVDPVSHALLLGRLFGVEVDELQQLQFPSETVVDAPSVVEVDDAVQTLEFVPFDHQPQPGSQYELLYSPKISILLPVYNTPTRFLKEVIQSVLAQSYGNWELCIVDDGSTLPSCQQVLREAAASDSRVKVFFSPCNGGIAASSQLALSLAEGEYIAFVDHDDILAHSALTDVVIKLREAPDIDYLYTDHAMINLQGEITSFALKPSWSPEFFLSTNYIVHFKLMRRSLVNKVGGFQRETSIVQDIGLTCRMIEGGAIIVHVPKVLYYWREHPESVASGTGGKPAIEALAIQAYDDHLKRRGIAAKVVWPSYFRARRSGVYKLQFETSRQPVALIALDPDGLCRPEDIEALIARTTDVAGVAAYIVRKGWPCRFKVAANVERCVVRDADGLMALVESLDVTRLVFVGPQPVPITPEWLRELVGYLDLSPEIGAVGGKVLDRHLTVRSGAFIFADSPFVLLGGLRDGADGYWFNGRAASNVEAVSARLMATTKVAYIAAGGLNLEQPDLAGLRYCASLRRLGLRVVFNPWSKIIDPAATGASSIAEFVPPGEDRYYSRRLTQARRQELGGL